MPIEAVPLVLTEKHRRAFNSVEAAADRINEILSMGEYVGQTAISAGKHDSLGWQDTCSEGVVYLINVPDAN